MAAGILGVLAVIGLLASALAVWARVTLFDSERVSDVVGNALAEPEVSEALAVYLADQVVVAVDLENAVTEALPPAVQRFGPAVAGGISGLVERSLSAALENDEVQAALTSAVRRAHAAAMRLLEGDGLLDTVTVVDGQVTVNLLPLLGRGLARVQQLGLLTDVQLPELTADGDPVEQIAALETALDRDLPDDFGQLVVYRSDTIAQAQASVESAQQAMALAKRAVWVLVVVTLVLLVATLVVARDRWRAALLLGLGAIVAMVVGRSAVERVVDEAPDVVIRPGANAAVTSILGDLGTSLLRVLGLVLVLAAIAVAVAVLTRRWRREDLIVITSVFIGVVLIGLLGLNIAALLLAVLAAVASAVALRRWWPTSTGGGSAVAPVDDDTTITPNEVRRDHAADGDDVRHGAVGGAEQG